MPYNVTTPPATEVLTLDTELRDQFLKIPDNLDDDLVNTLIATVREYYERQYDLAFVTQTITEYFDSWPDGDCLILSVRPVQSVNSVKYYDEDDNIQTFSGGSYRLDSSSQLARLQRDESVSWPDLKDKINAVEISYEAGYGAASAVPENVKQSMRMMVSLLYAQREDGFEDRNVIFGKIFSIADKLIMPERALIV